MHLYILSFNVFLFVGTINVEPRVTFVLNHTLGKRVFKSRLTCPAPHKIQLMRTRARAVVPTWRIHNCLTHVEKRGKQHGHCEPMRFFVLSATTWVLAFSALFIAKRIKFEEFCVFIRPVTKLGRFVTVSLDSRNLSTRSRKKRKGKEKKKRIKGT